VFVSVVPDEFYFLWQIELQLLNFSKFGIPKEEVQILIGKDRTYGLSIWFSDFIERNADKASFFVYPREVDVFGYRPSIRPHLLKQHFSRYPELADEVIFYHDSDIIFRELPDFEKLCAGDEWYLADCRSYIDSRYLKSKAEGLFEGMCTIMEIDPALVVSADDVAGGAQYILKGMTAEFWAKMEDDCERLFGFMKDYSVQSWCADMWVLFWTGLKMNKKMRLSDELAFTWAADPIEEYTTCKIYHNAGAADLAGKVNYTVFNKVKFQSHPPYYSQHDRYSKEVCSFEYVRLIREWEDRQPKADLSDTSFLIPLYIDSSDRLLNLEITTRYLYKHFKTTTIVVEAGPEQRVDPSLLAPNVDYHFIEDHDPSFHRTRYNNHMVSLCRTKFLALYDVDVILSPAQIMESVAALREGNAVISYPYSGIFYATAPWLGDIFRMVLDHTVFQRFDDKHSVASRRSLGGCVFLDKETFIACGGENQRLTSWGPDDIERAARYKILGYTIHRTSGVLYHLHHERGRNSGYHADTSTRLLAEYLRVCSLTRNELADYIQTWDYFSN
jgi:hypothetical protein